jgi:hypothetical protein
MQMAAGLGRRENVNGILIALAIALVISGFLLTVSFDEPQIGGIVVFAGLVPAILLFAGNRRPGDAPAVRDTGFPFVLLVLTLGVAPLALVVMETFHPHGFSDHVYDYLEKPEDLYFGPAWWTALHVAQTPLVSIVGAGLLLLARGIPGTFAWLARIATIFFIIYYAVLDTLAGVGVGVLIEHTKDWTGPERQTANELVQFLFTNDWVGGTGSVLSQTASWLAFLAFASVALTIARAGAPLVGAFFLGAAGVLIQIAHTRPYGPLGFACVVAAAIVLVPWRAGRSVPGLAIERSAGSMGEPASGSAGTAGADPAKP